MRYTLGGDQEMLNRPHRFCALVRNLEFQQHLCLSPTGALEAEPGLNCPGDVQGLSLQSV